jgi:hypothetical protein
VFRKAVAVGLAVVSMIGLSGCIGLRTTDDLPDFADTLKEKSLMKLCLIHDRAPWLNNTTPGYRDGVIVAVSRELERRDLDPLACRSSSKK